MTVQKRRRIVYGNHLKFVQWVERRGILGQVNISRDVPSNIVTLSCLGEKLLIRRNDIVEFSPIGIAGWEIGVWDGIIGDGEFLSVKRVDDNPYDETRELRSLYELIRELKKELKEKDEYIENLNNERGE